MWNCACGSAATLPSCHASVNGETPASPMNPDDAPRDQATRNLLVGTDAITKKNRRRNHARDAWRKKNKTRCIKGKAKRRRRAPRDAGFSGDVCVRSFFPRARRRLNCSGSTDLNGRDLTRTENLGQINNTVGVVIFRPRFLVSVDRGRPGFVNSTPSVA